MVMGDGWWVVDGGWWMTANRLRLLECCRALCNVMYSDDGDGKYGYLARLLGGGKERAAPRAGTLSRWCWRWR